MTDEDLLEQGLANQHRYKGRAPFCKTGVGYLAPTTPEDYARDEELSQARIKRALKRMEEKSTKSIKSNNATS